VVNAVKEQIPKLCIHIPQLMNGISECASSISRFHVHGEHTAFVHINNPRLRAKSSQTHTFAPDVSPL